VLVDANVLLYAVDAQSRQHEGAREWLEDALNGQRRVGMPWASLTAFVRIATNPRAMDMPLTPAQAWTIVESWLDVDIVWIPAPGRGHRAILGRLLTDLDLRANLVPDAVLAALCLEHGLRMISADTDFARFSELDWFNPAAS
jgi:hypothetical protein